MLPLHSSLSSEDQKAVFKRPPPGITKVVLATNIAETSITIDDVVFVIDSGKAKLNKYDPNKRMSSLVESWISRANAKQRKGRAGRVQAGHCFRLYTRQHHDEKMQDFEAPEMLRAPVESLVLQIKTMRLRGHGAVRDVFGRALQPPTDNAVDSALNTLDEIAALDEDERLTPLGTHLAALPVDVRVGKMMLFGAIFGCLEPVLIIAAAISHKSPFVAPIDSVRAPQPLYYA